jgi:hypothetical protein
VRPLWFCLLACGGCGSYFADAGRDASSAAVAAATSEESRRKLAKLAGDMAGEASSRATQELFGQQTDDALQDLVQSTGESFRGEASTLVTPALQEHLRQTVRLTLDEALGPVTRAEIASLRDDFFGPVLQVEVNGLIDSAAPHLADAVARAMSAAVVPVDADVARIQRTADAEAMKWRPIAEGFAAGTGLLALGLAGALVVIRRHGRAIEELRGGSGRPEVASTR